MSEKKEFTERVLIMDEAGLHIKDPEIAEKLEKKSISASMITGLESCAARWLMDSFVTRDLIEEEPDNAARRGSLFHKVMEDFFALDKEERTQTAVKEIAKEVVNSEEFVDLSRNRDVLTWLKDAIEGYYAMGSNPQNVNVAEIVMNEDKGPQKGLEIFVKGKIGNANRETLGFIDRLSLSGKDGKSLIVEDFKSGAKVKQWKSHTKSNEGWAEQRQQLIYKLLLEQKGFEVSGARLIYPVARQIVKVDTNDETLVQKVIQDVENTDKALDTMIETNTFEYTPSFLCHFCALAKICVGAGYINKKSDKLREAFNSQPDSEVLLQAIQMQ